MIINKEFLDHLFKLIVRVEMIYSSSPQICVWVKVILQGTAVFFIKPIKG